MFILSNNHQPGKLAHISFDRINSMSNRQATQYSITPYASVNEYIFGLSPKKIRKSCGEPYRIVIDNIMENLTEEREACSLVYEENKLASILINKHAEPRVNGISIYSEGAIAELMTLDNDHLAGARYINFRTLGLCIGGFSKKRIPEGRLVIAYAKDKVSYFDFFASDN